VIAALSPNIWIDRDAYLTLGPPDIPSIGVGKDGEKVDFIAMGTVLMGMTMTTKNGDQVPKGMLIEKAYLPAKGHSAINIISTGRWFEMQRVKIFLNDVMKLEIGDFTHDFSAMNYSPCIVVKTPEIQRGSDELQLRVHLTGVPKHTMLRAAHLRLGHAAFDHTANVFDLKATRTCKCYVCLIFKARGPSPSRTPMTRRAQKVGALVSLDAWCYAVPAAVTGWINVLGGVDEYADLFDVIGSKEPTGKITSDFLEYLWLIYQSEYRTELVAVRIDNGSVFDCLEFRTRAAKLHIRIELSAPYLHFQLRIERHWQTMKRDGACMLATACRKKTLFIHACLHAAMIRCVTRLPAKPELGDDETQTKSAYEVATGKKYPLEALRVWGANAYGTLMPEQ
jgi:hypothetical protein